MQIDANTKLFSTNNLSPAVNRSTSMSSPFIGEIRLVGFNFAPVNWAFCDGQIMSIAQNEALFDLLGTIYGGDGVTTFAIPDLRGRVAIQANSSSPGVV